MAHIVTERCVNCRYTDCCTVCPVDCFYEITDPAMLVIDPNTCIDCEACVPECPINAIWPADELPAEYAEWTDKNEALFGGGTMIKTRKDPLEGALDLATLQAREKERNWTIVEPSTAGGDEEEDEGAEAAAATGPASADDVLAACTAGKYKWRSARGIGRELNAPAEHVEVELEKLLGEGKLTKFDAATNAKAPAVYGPV